MLSMNSTGILGMLEEGGLGKRDVFFLFVFCQLLQY